MKQPHPSIINRPDIKLPILSYPNNNKTKIYEQNSLTKKERKHLNLRKSLFEEYHKASANKVKGAKTAFR